MPREALARGAAEAQRIPAAGMALQKSTLAGLAWIAEFVTDDTNFDFIFSDYVVMLYELSLNGAAPAVQELAQQLARLAFERARGRLEQIFPATYPGKLDFVSIIPILHHFDVALSPFLRFYREHFPKGDRSTYDVTFAQARATLDYDALGDYLIDAWFVQLANSRFADTPFALPANPYPAYLRAIAELPFVYGVEQEDDYHDQNYFLTHVALVMSNYGANPLPEGPLRERLRAYFIDNYDAIRYRVDDLDLLAEVLQCLRLLDGGDADYVQSGLRFVLSQQHPDGSWGTPADAAGDPYDAFHPTWAAITALNGFVH